MPKRSDSPLLRELDEIRQVLTSDSKSPEARQRWEAIWREMESARVFPATELLDVLDVMSLGRYMAEVDGRFDLLADMILRYFEHPRAEEARAGWMRIYPCWIAHELLKSGHEDKAIAFMQALIDRPVAPRSPSDALRDAVVALRNDCWEQDGKALASAAVTDLAHEVVHRLKQRKVRQWQPGGKPYAELVEMLISTHRPADREALLLARQRQQSEDYNGNLR